MIPKEELLQKVSESNHYQDYLKIVRKYLVHGTPYVFRDREEDFYEFRELIANNFNINFHEVLIMGSAKMGYSYHKDSNFSAESDIDVALVNEQLFEFYYKEICAYQYDKSKALFTTTQDEEKLYFRFLKYLVRGWMRPDLLPTRVQIATVKNNWFDFFNSISHGRSNVGNYIVTGGVFKSYQYLERYYVESLSKVKKTQSNN